MASVNMDNGKCGMNKALYGITRHNYRTGKNHSNKDIDPSRSHLNKHYGPQTAEEYRERFRAMVEACDAKKPPRRRKKDRKVLLTMDVPSPREGMSPEDEARWSAKVYEVMQELFGDMVVGSTYHADEIHEYTDPHDKQRHKSRGHTHTGVIPWTNEYGLNMDKFYRRDLPNKINAALDKACMEMFGFPFRDGSQKKSRGTVEQLKLESTIAEREQAVEQVKEYDQIIEMQERVIQQQDKQIADTQQALQAAQDEADRLKASNSTLQGQNEALRTNNKIIKDERDAAIKERNNAQEEVKNLKEKIEAVKKELMEWTSKLQGEIVGIFKKLNSARRIASASPWLSDDIRSKIVAHSDAIAARTEKAVEKPMISSRGYSCCCSLELSQTYSHTLSQI